jgi:hypothetical protein
MLTQFFMPSGQFFEFITSPLMFFYFLCAVFGGALVLLQFLLMLLGFDGSDDSGDYGNADGHSATGDIFKVLSLRTLTAGIAFFGFGGLAGLTAELKPSMSVLIAIISGLTAMYIVYFLYQSAARLKEDGSLTNETLVGSTGSVYVRIPPAKSGIGKVLICQQGRTIEYEALTAGDELKATTPIVVVGIVSSTTVEVAQPSC